MKAAALLLLIPLLAVAAPVPKETDAQKIEKAFGKPVDPNKDCEFAFDGKKLTIKAGKGDHALLVQHNRMSAPRTLRAVEGDFRAEVKASAEHPKEAKPVVPGRDFLFHSQGLVLWADENNYVRFEQARIAYPNEDPKGYVSYELFREGKWVRAGTAQDGELDPTKPARFRLARTGNEVVGSWSADDGKTWTDLPKLELELKAKVQVGVVVNHNTDTAFAAVFENFAVTPKK